MLPGIIHIQADPAIMEKVAALDNEIRPTSRPDTDNYVKGVLDALNGTVVKDDSIIVDLIAQKFYSNIPRIELEVTEG